VLPDFLATYNRPKVPKSFWQYKYQMAIKYAQIAIEIANGHS
jgi:hypothetical protein